ncbi:unnamed protein product, partial [Closterium sp. NIES-54]
MQPLWLHEAFFTMTLRSSARAPPNGAASTSPSSASARSPASSSKRKPRRRVDKDEEARMEANKKASKLRKPAYEEVEEVEEVDEADEEEVAVVKGKGKGRAKAKEVEEEVEEEQGEQEGEDASVEEKDVIPKREANARWPERCKEVKGVKHYSAVTMDGHLYKLGDDVT